MGADDYVTKPFGPRELVARLEANLRRVMRTRYRIDDFQKTYFVIDNFFEASAYPLNPVVEYYNLSLDHYFITTNPAEMAKLDDDASGWQRTGGVFLAYSADRTARALTPPQSAVSMVFHRRDWILTFSRHRPRSARR